MLRTHAVSVARRVTFLFAAAVLANGCKEPAREPALSAAAAPETVAEAPTVPQKDTIGSGSINWTLRVLKFALSDMGLNPIEAGEVRQPFLGGPGMRYQLNGGELQAYIYADAGAVARDTDRLSPATVSPPGLIVHWRMPPSLIVSNNLALILLTNDPQVRRKVRDAVKADLTRHDTTQLSPDKKSPSP